MSDGKEDDDAADEDDDEEASEKKEESYSSESAEGSEGSGSDEISSAEEEKKQYNKKKHAEEEANKRFWAPWTDKNMNLCVFCVEGGGEKESNRAEPLLIGNGASRREEFEHPKPPSSSDIVPTPNMFHFLFDFPAPNVF